MSLKPQPPRELPPEIAAWAANHLPTDSRVLALDAMLLRFRITLI